MNLQQQINHLKTESFIADLALGFEPEIEVAHKWDLLNEYHDRGFNYVGLAIAGEFTNLETTIRYMARHRARIMKESDKYILVDTFQDLVDAQQQKKLALSFWLQGSNPLANDIHMIETYYRLGIRYMLLCYNTRNAIGDGVVEKNDGGLSQFGYKVIEEMNRVGMIVDLSHTGIKTSLDAIAASVDPVIFSHSNTAAVTSHVRNITNEQIVAIGENDGLIGINGLALFSGEQNVSIKKIVDHMDHILNLIGPKHIALGLDQVYFHELLELFYQKAGDVTYPKGYVQSMDSFQLQQIDQLIHEMLVRNYSEDIIKDILGNNFLRVAKQVWK